MAAPNDVIKVVCTIEVPISRHDWGLAYGDDSVRDIRDSVKADADELVKAHFARTGVLATDEGS